MAIDYRIYDLRNLFHLRDVAMAWCEIEDLTSENKGPYISMSWALLEAVWIGELQKEPPFLKNSERSPRPPFDLTFSREELTRWAISKGQKPKFLFPEERTFDISASPRQSQIDKARCQAIAQALWEMEPTRTAKDMAGDKRILKYGNGAQYGEKTLQDWLREIDVRSPEQKTGRPKKAIEAA